MFLFFLKWLAVARQLYGCENRRLSCSSVNAETGQLPEEGTVDVNR